jgi:hypothetical protein
MSEEIELLIGSDFGAPLKAGEQAKKTIAIEALRTAVRRYEILATGRNERLVRERDDAQSWSYNRRGWTIPGLAESVRNDDDRDCRLRFSVFNFAPSTPDLVQCCMERQPQAVSRQLQRIRGMR